MNKTVEYVFKTGFNRFNLAPDNLLFDTSPSGQAF